VEFHKPKSSNCSTTINIKQNPKPNEGVEAVNKVSRVMQDPLDVPLMGPNTIHGPKTKRVKDGVATSWQILVHQLVLIIPNDSS
jgi:DUF1009 family protein